MEQNLTPPQSNKVLNGALLGAILIVIGGAIFIGYKLLPQKTPAQRSNTTNSVTTAITPLKSIHKNLKVTDPNKISVADYTTASERFVALGQAAFSVTTDDDMKTMAIYFRGNDTDDARHILQAMHIQDLQLALNGYFGLHSAYPDNLSSIVTDWKSIQAYCLQHESICNGGALRLEDAPSLIDMYTGQPYVYTTTTSDFTIKYFMTGCDSKLYCADDDTIFINGENIATKEHLSNHQGS